jgi:NAD(P)-dependent dehydrogenase (short-subunit alcohol dehydrogenase family)
MTNPTRPKTVLVTGAARRLGREIALALAKGGWQVAVHYRESQQEAADTVSSCVRLAELSGHHGVGSESFQADLQDEVAVRALLPKVIARFGGVDAVINNAAIFEHDSAASFGFAALDRHLHANTGAAILLAQALHEHVLARATSTDTASRQPGPLGVVVNLLDQKLWNQNPDFLSYTLSKAALEAANTMLALALAPHLRVVGVAPGLTLTSHLLSEEKFKALHTQSPLGRSSSAEDVAASVKFALENTSITGTTLLVDGGQHLMKFDRDFSLM